MGQGNEKPSKGKLVRLWPATVAKVIDPWRVVINRGEVHGIKEGQRFLIYRLSVDEIVDPATGESLGRLEYVKGTGRVTHIQEKMSIVESDRREPAERRIVKSGSPLGLTGPRTQEEIVVPSSLAQFDDPRVGDEAKPI